MFASITPIVGGLVLFVVGLQFINSAVAKLSGSYLKVGLSLLTGNRFGGVAVGTALSFVLASSAGATVLLVGMGDAGLVTLRQAVAVVLGAAIGTTLVVQVIAFDVGQWALYVVALGFLLRTLGRYERWREAGNAVFGLGFLFFGMALMKQGVQNAFVTTSLMWAEHFLERLATNPFYVFAFSMAATAVLQSSATTMAMALALGVSVPTAIPVAIGASVGTCTAGLVSGIAAKPIGRQIALAHFLMKLVGASFFMYMLGPFTSSVELWALRLGIEPDARLIAHANTLYTVLYAAIFLPLVPVVERLVSSLVTGGKGARPGALLSISDLDDPQNGIRKARSQAADAGRSVLGMLRESLTGFMMGPYKISDDILDRGAAVDNSVTVVSDFLTRLEARRLTAQENEKCNRLLYAAHDVAYIGDVAAGELVPLVLKKSRSGLEFSIEGAQHFERLHRRVADDFSEALDILEGLSESGGRILARAGEVDAMRKELVHSHMRRVSQGVVADVETSRILMDAVAAIRVIHYYVCDIIQIMEPAEPSQLR